MLENMLTRKGVMRAGKGAVRAGRRYNNMDHMNKSFYFHSVHQAILRWLSVLIKSIGLMMFIQEIIYFK